MTEIVPSCPLCGSQDAVLFDQRPFRGHHVSNQICKACGLVYQSPRMTEAERQAFYEDEYRLLYQGQASPSLKDLNVQSARAESTLIFIQPWVMKLSNILDIGCSTGIMLQNFKARFQAQATGVEPGLLYREYAQGLDLDVFSSLEDLPPSDPNPFDLISMMHVLEHLPEPVAYLQGLREKLLHPKGWLLLEVPNLYAHDCFEVAHLVSFSPHTLEQVVAKAGFRITRCRLHGMPRSKLIPLYITLLAQPDADITYSLIPDHRVRLKRQIGFLRRRLVTRLFPGQAWFPVRDNNQESLGAHA